jgi:hypothetical protein
MLSSSVLPSNAFLTRHLAPTEIASLSRFLSGKAVIRITGIVAPCSRSFLTSSRPLIPGMAMSATRQSSRGKLAEERNVSAEENGSARCPEGRIRSTRAEHTASSSSMIPTKDRSPYAAAEDARYGLSAMRSGPYPNRPRGTDELAVEVGQSATQPRRVIIGSFPNECWTNLVPDERPRCC